MGRTVPSFRQALETEINRWENFRKALRDKDVEAFADGGNGCRYCIAPVLPADWERAAMFSALFYTFLFYGEPHFPRPGKPQPPLKPYEPVTAFKKAKKRLPRLTGWWKMFDYGTEIP